MMVLEADQQFLLRAVAEVQKSIATAIFSSLKSTNNKTSNSARSRNNGTTPRNPGMTITHKTIKNPLTITDGATSSHGHTSSGKYDEKDLIEYKKQLDRINFPVIEYTPLASCSVLDSTERSTTLQKHRKNSLGSRGSPYSDYEDRWNHTDEDRVFDSTAPVEARLKSSQFHVSNVFYNSNSFYNENSTTNHSKSSKNNKLNSSVTTFPSLVNVSGKSRSNSEKGLLKSIKGHHTTTPGHHTKGHNHESKDNNDSDDSDEETEKDKQGIYTATDILIRFVVCACYYIYV